MSAPTRPRIAYRKLAEANAAMFSLHAAVTDGPLEAPLLDLVRIRASQLNGCAFCLDMHSRDAREGGETTQRLDVLAGWREAPVFTERERAALAFTDAVTLLAGSGVPDAVLDEAETWFDAEELATLLFAVAEINAWNRLAVTARTPVPQRGD
jgi:AhpD family alkylhydroperoxidase